MFSFSAFESKYFYFNFGSKWSNYSSELNYLGEVFKGKLLSIELPFVLDAASAPFHLM